MHRLCFDVFGEHDYCEGDGCGEPLCRNYRYMVNDLALCHKCYKKLLVCAEVTPQTRRPAFALPADEQQILNSLLRKAA